MPDNRKPLIYGAFPVCRNYTVRAYILDAGNPKRHRPENGRGDPRSRLGGILAGRLHTRHNRHEKRSRAKNQRLHGKRRMTAKMNRKAHATCRKSSGRRRILSSGDFRSEFPFGSRLGQTENVQNSPSEKVTKTQKNPAETARFQPDLVGVAGFEPAASWSRTKRATNCATPRHSRFIIISIFPSVKREIARSGANPGGRPIPPPGSGR